jgi:hypothetical protein
MPERAKSLASAFIASTLALAVLLGVNATASAAAECLESPDLHVTQPGHWTYHTDRSLNRRCWHFDPAEAAANTQAAPPVTAVNEDSQQSLFSRLFSPSPQQASLFSPPWQQPSPPQQPQESSNPNNAVESAQTISSKPAKPARTARREQPKTPPPPTTNGAATAERRDQSRQPAAEKNEKRDPPINVADREALFQDFVKWQMERNLFGRP